ncbi:Dabb family protein [Robiginitalea sp. M366]|uniref:Dabb family protein n=1 Tax=Robiginitalea aestuariiviva TaxID=3036903 RepID=UPI00240E4E75|nr:Dabb family protein [Robiginitalea aestuariiviva]MDG1571094.1 Dabb family protein [Robiginitalea aestuariiviva]
MKTNFFLAALALLCWVAPAQSQSETSMNNFDPSFAHTVYFWLHNPESAQDRQAFEKALKTFLSRSQYAKTLFIGTPPSATRDVVDGSFTYSLIVSFESAEAQAAYQSEQPHLDFIAEAEHLWKKVIVYDSIGLDAGE